MASIQILELRPVEAEIEDLSNDITSSIHGGDVEIDDLLSSIFDFIEEIIGDADIGIGQVLRCTGDFISGRTNLGEFLDCLFA